MNKLNELITDTKNDPGIDPSVHMLLRAARITKEGKTRKSLIVRFARAMPNTAHHQEFARRARNLI